MAFFRFSAEDEHGTRHTGTVEAASSAEALRGLRQRGLKKAQIEQSVASVPRPAEPQPVRQAPFVPVAKPAAPTAIRTRKASDKARYFLFSQLSKQLGAGIPPSKAFENIAQTARPPFLEPLRHLAKVTGEGRPMSDALSLYPDLFPNHVCGMVRVGEVSGYLPEALMKVSEQAGAAHAFKRFHWFAGPVVLHAAILIPTGWVLVLGILHYWDELMKGAQLSVWEALYWAFRWPAGPTALALTTTLLVLYRLWMSRPFMVTRHKLGLFWPMLGRRAKHESIEVFSWALSRASTAGIHPLRAWESAVDAVPNVEMRARLIQTGSKLRENSRLSEAIFNSKLFGEEYAPILSTGELTGDVAGTLERLAQVERGEFQTATTRAKIQTASWGCTTMIIAAGVVLIMITIMWYRTLPEKALNELECLFSGIILSWH